MKLQPSISSTSFAFKNLTQLSEGARNRFVQAAMARLKAWRDYQSDKKNQDKPSAAKRISVMRPARDKPFATKKFPFRGFNNDANVESSWKFWLTLIVLVGGFFRFAKLDWGDGYFFHPDEYHISSAVDKLSFPFQMDPHFYAYGSFPIYLIYFARAIIFALFPDYLFSPILIGRFFSAFFSTITILFVFLSARITFRNHTIALLPALLAALTPGLIQQAHFATPESSLTFFIFLCLWLWLSYLRTTCPVFLYVSAISLGLAVASKISAVSLLPVFVFLPFFKRVLSSFRSVLAGIARLGVCLLLVLVSFLSVFPFALYSFSAFSSSLSYEIGVGRGEPIVFYTRQFIDTAPLLFHTMHILPYALGPAMLGFGGVGFLIVVSDISLLRFGTKRDRVLWGLLVIVFLALFLPQIFLFAKWTRFIAPSFAFFSLFSTYFFYRISPFLKSQALGGVIQSVACLVLLLPTIFWALAVSSVYFRRDVRVLATAWVAQQLPPRSFLLTESGNILEVPLWGEFRKDAFDFYELEHRADLQRQLPTLLSQADYFIVQSRRIFFNHQRLPAQFPFTSRFYDLLFSGSLGFESMATFSSYPRLSFGRATIEIPDEVAEETWSVFDHPVVRIFRKSVLFTEAEYEELLTD